MSDDLVLHDPPIGLAPAPELLATPRLVLRRWRDDDREPFAALCADPEVMRYFPAPLSRAEADDLVDRIEGHFDRLHYGLWATEVAGTGDFIGFVGLMPAIFPAPFTPAVEVGWRLARAAWGQGLATEAARAALADGFDRAGFDEIVSFTARINRPSWRVMERLGMTHDVAGDFDHPRVAEGDPLRPHVLYRLSRTEHR